MKPAALNKTKKTSKGSSTADQLLEATSKILVERNTIDVSLSEIAEFSGLNSALIKYHFGSKDGLLLALVRRDAAISLERLDWLVKMNVTLEKKVRLHVAGIINTYTRYPYLNRLIHVLLTHSEETITREIAHFFVRPLVDSQSKILDEGVAQGVFRRVSPMFFYYSIVGACDYIFFGRYSLKFVYGVDEITKQMKDDYIDFISDMTLRMLRKE